MVHCSSAFLSRKINRYSTSLQKQLRPERVTYFTQHDEVAISMVMNTSYNLSV